MFRSFIRKKKTRNALIALALSCLFAILILCDAFLPISNYMMDSLYQRGGKTSDIIIVGIDDYSLEKLGKYDDWNRGYMAMAIHHLSEKNPAVIGLDILFTGQEFPESDELLVKACSEASCDIVTGANLIFKASFDPASTSVRTAVSQISYPYPALQECVKTGYVNALLDSSDGYARRVRPVMDCGETEMDSFAYAIYRSYQTSRSETARQFNSSDVFRFNYSASSGQGYSIVSFYDVYEGRVPSDTEGSIVLIGALASGLQDSYFTPIDRGSQSYGVEIHANIIDAFLKDELIVETPKWLVSLVSLVLLFLFAFLILEVKTWISSVSGLVALLALFGIQSLLYIWHVYCPFTGLFIGLIASFIVCVVFRYGEEFLQRRKTVQTFKKYVAPQVVDQALKDGSFHVDVGGTKRRIACLFVDIRGFTTLSESLPPEDVVSILNEYLTLTTSAVFEAGGTLDKFIGDATMALFNAPFDLPDYAYRSVRAAWLIAQGSERIDKIAFEKYGKHCSFGIGINLGDAVVGNIGSDARMDYTAIGDTVNTASRLESNAKAGEILISEALYEEVKDRVEAEPIGPLALKGKSVTVNTYKVISLKED